MRITLSWLSEFVDVSDLSAKDVADIMTDIGIEVDGVRETAKDVEKVVIGKITSIAKHPNADKLKICKVRINGEKTLQIITAADNVYEGAIVPVALHGAKLANGLKIKRSKLRGEVSEGMLCSAVELGIADSSAGVWTLPKECEKFIGQDAVKTLQLRDFVIEYEITTNRPDHLCVLGVAREIACVLRRELILPEVSYHSSSKKVSDEISLSVIDPACERYRAGFAQVKITDSPLLVQKRLFMLGHEPINNVVDLTNYVMFELGQPLHAFDAEKIEGQRIVVRRAKKGEKLITFDGTELSLTEEDLVIADTQRPLALAGIIGSKDSGVSPLTSKIVLESAHFEPVTIRKSAKRFGITTDASYRFERGADIEAVSYAAGRFCNLLSQQGAAIYSDAVEHYPKRYQPKVIALDPAKVRKLIGEDIPSRRSFEVLSRLGFSPRKEQDYVVVRVPSWRRYDVSREVDLIEEVVRIYGMKNVQSTYPLMHSNVERSFKHLTVKRLKELLADMGMDEAINYSFVGKKLYEIFGFEVEGLIKIKNPLSEEWVFMRDRLFPSLVKNAVENLARHEESVCLFEVSKVFIPKPSSLPDEPLRVAGVFAGKTKDGIFKDREFDFYDAKSVVEAIFELFRIDPEFRRSSEKFLHPGKSADIFISGKKIGFLGVVHPEILEKMDVKKQIIIFEISLNELFSDVREIKFKKLAKFPPVKRDIALLVPKDMPAKTVEETIRNSVGKFLENLKLFDVYEGDNIPKDKKSLAFSLRFRSAEKTLSEEEVNKLIDVIIEKLKEKGVTLRA